MTDTIAWSRELHTLAQRFGQAIAVDDGHAQLSFADLNGRAHALACALQAQGVGAGDYVGIYLPNGGAAVWADYGVTISGACLVHLNAAYTRDEIMWAQQLTPMRHIITDRALAPTVADLGAALVLCEDIAPLDTPPVLPAVNAADPGRVIFSSGTTGKPKALLYDQGRRWLAAVILRAVLPFTPGPGSRVLLMTPYVHGASMQARAWLDHGGTAVLLKGVEREAVGRELRSGTLDAVFAPPTMLAKLAASFDGERFPSVRCVFTGTQTLTPGLYAKARAMFGPTVRITYGKSENVNPITVLDPQATQACFDANPAEGACLGWPAPGVQLRINDHDEIELRSRHMYIGHIDQEGFHAPPADGWHRTGDLGRIDEHGRLWLLGRMADVIKSGGYKIYPDEIEAALAGMPDCGDICVVALPSDYWGEVIIAVAEHAAPAWHEAARQRVAQLARYKHPRAHIAVAALPRNPQGKISRRAVRDLVLSTHTLIDGSYPSVEARGSIHPSVGTFDGLPPDR
ncbi:class I adenylate-forming enzyme family protein [Bordetella holmesii]|uniref:AMP-binding enzyme n=2 Tax=Bordetella holmesii TaxID=35814 RepID=A0A158M6Z8_9BORD|nr:class I adenylate-forming enzyme family protein [Bordetella holmesii]AHV93034.1 AMP-binding enzyme family protein [Bordetella holmesii ATCC 51541]AIT25103.1 AMP-binding enzyme family protein [Bordetella holmesii 44057]EWM45666.1 AMP-binding enzyme family protein [Bordetella holmesii 70147]EWM48860.1 AMP-binding enzyme family protein [Bordetella holmesii 41130]EWM49790.1 AMP-binding enzyme family protein [Bordetella holmesii 35009]